MVSDNPANYEGCTIYKGDNEFTLVAVKEEFLAEARKKYLAKFPYNVLASDTTIVDYYLYEGAKEL